MAIWCCLGYDQTLDLSFQSQALCQRNGTIRTHSVTHITILHDHFEMTYREAAEHKGISAFKLK